MIPIPGCTLMAADTAYHGATIASLKKSMKQCKFDRVVLFTNIAFNIEGVEVIQIPPLKSKDEYSYFMLKEAWKHISTDYVLVTQHDSWVLEGSLFDTRLYDTDYAGALWLENDGLANGNGGFSWRSRRLMETVGKDDLINATSPEDVALCRVYRRYLETNYGLIWASDELCERFSFELRSPIKPTFGFHSYFHKPYQKTVIIRREGAYGDVVALEPLLHYFYKKDYRVVLDTLPQIFNLFLQHYFKVHHPQEIDQRHLNSAEVYNLDLSYENNPKQLHLKSYFEFCGISESEMELRNPKLSLSFDYKDPNNKIFPKYAVIHYDHRPQGGRNIHGVEWDRVCWTLNGKGYTVVQIGKGERERIDEAIQMNTPSEPFLLWVIGGADLFIGADSGPANIAVAVGTPSIIMFGSVNPKYIYPEPEKVTIIHNHHKRPCELPYCWHESTGTTGTLCYIKEASPPCIQFETQDIIDAIEKICN